MSTYSLAFKTYADSKTYERMHFLLSEYADSAGCTNIREDDKRKLWYGMVLGENEFSRIYSDGWVYCRYVE